MCANNRNNSLTYLLGHRFRSRVRTAFERAGFERDTEYIDMLGISMKEYAKYIEYNFEEGMSIENRHLWQIDHIVPLGSAKTKEELIKLFHYTNTRPLWTQDNQEKNGSVYNGDITDYTSDIPEYIKEKHIYKPKHGKEKNIDKTKNKYVEAIGKIKSTTAPNNIYCTCTPVPIITLS